MNREETLNHLRGLPPQEGIAMAAILLAFVLKDLGPESPEANDLRSFLIERGQKIAA